jgi:DNA invertase Pin-like site-specific DNA recombinase
VLAAIARKDYEDQSRRQKEAIVKAKLEGRYPGRPNDIELKQKIEGMLLDKNSMTIFNIFWSVPALQFPKFQKD